MRIWLFPKALWLFLFVSHSSRIQYSKCENSKAIYRQSSSTTTEQKQAEQQSTTICSSRSELELRQASGHFCSTNNDCTEPYNVCRQRKCRCGIGMMKTCNQCLPRKLRCPFGEPLMRGQSAWRWIEYSAPIRQETYTSMVFAA
ncbi:Lytic polysaccharide monooxygenase 13A [Trichinella pseudospiralis]